MKKDYIIPVNFIFKGDFLIKANSRKEARNLADKNCGMTIALGIHSTLPNEDVNWDFPTHPEKVIGK